MIVKSRRPIFITSKLGGSRSNIKSNFDSESSYFDADGKPTNSDEVKKFQDWLNSFKSGWDKTVKSTYGKYPMDIPTSSAWAIFGKEFKEKYLSPLTKTDFKGIPYALPETKPTDPNLSITDPKGNKRAGQFWDKARNVWVRAKDSGLLDALGNLIRPGGQQQQPTWTGEQTQQGIVLDEKKKEKEGGLTTTQIVLIVGGALGLGVLIYFMNKKTGVENVKLTPSTVGKV